MNRTVITALRLS